MGDASAASPAGVLSIDCWLLICDLVSFEDLLSISRTSKSLYAAVVPRIYRTISLSWNRMPLARILQLTRTVLQRPELASYIQHVSFLSHKKQDEDNPWKPPGCNITGKRDSLAQVLHDAQRIVTETGFPNAEKWIRALEQADAYAFVAILLSQLHNLQSLQLDYSFVWRSGFPGLMLRHALLCESNQLSKFASLTDVNYGANVRISELCEGVGDACLVRGYPDCDPEQFPAWFYLPRLQSLSIWLRTNQDLFVLPGQSNMSQLHSLVLSRSTIREEQVPTILSATKELKTLHLGIAYRWCGLYEGIGGDGKWDIAFQNGPAILEGLGYVKDTLTHLSISWEYYPLTDGQQLALAGEEEIMSRLQGCIKDFTSLETAEMPLSLLLGWRTETAADLVTAVPTTLRRLCLRADPGSAFENEWNAYSMFTLLNRTVAGLRSRTPRLEEVALREWDRLAYNIRDYEEWAPRLEQTRMACAQQGIHLRVIFDQLSTGLWTYDGLPPYERTMD